MGTACRVAEEFVGGCDLELVCRSRLLGGQNTCWRVWGLSWSTGGAHQVVEKFTEGGLVREGHQSGHPQATDPLADELKTVHGDKKGASLCCGLAVSPRAPC